MADSKRSVLGSKPGNTSLPFIPLTILNPPCLTSLILLPSFNIKLIKMSRITKKYIRHFIFEQKCIPWRIIVLWRRIVESCRSGRIRSFMRQLIIRPAWLTFLLKNTFYKKSNWRIGFISYEFEHLDLMPFGGYGMTLKFVTNYLNNNGKPLKADVLMCQRKDIPAVTVKGYHSADLIFLPRRQ